MELATSLNVYWNVYWLAEVLIPPQFLRLSGPQSHPLGMVIEKSMALIVGMSNRTIVHRFIYQMGCLEGTHTRSNYSKISYLNWNNILLRMYYNSL